MSKSPKKKQMSRRDFLMQIAAAGAIGIPFSKYILPDSVSIIPDLTAQSPSSIAKLFHIHLDGGIDSLMATDPPNAPKLASGNYDPTYAGLATSTVTGKGNLVVGEGLQPALTAFQNMNTCFINGIRVQVNAHDLAQPYAMTGELSLSRSREYPAAAARIAANVSDGAAVPHATLGGAVPLGTTKNTVPPVGAQSPDELANILGGPYTYEGFIGAGNVNTAVELIRSLDILRGTQLQQNQINAMNQWSQSSNSARNVYAGNYHTLIPVTTTQQTNYNVSSMYDVEGLVPGALNILASGMTRRVTLRTGGYDTHQSHLSPHRDLMQRFATVLTQLVSDLQSTADPDNGGQMLADNTTILITTEFNRTPMFNVADGTDHWPTSCAIVMGPNVNDNTVIGATGNDGEALGWNGVAAEPLVEGTNELLHDHVIKTVLNQFSTAAADELDEVSVISGVFT